MFVDLWLTASTDMNITAKVSESLQNVNILTTSRHIEDSSIQDVNESLDLKGLSHLDVLASVWQRIKMYVKRWRTLNY